MADIKRETKTDDDVTLPDALRQRAEAYSAMAVAHSTVTFTQRRNFDTSAVRHLNNFVKACVLDVAARVLCAVCPSTRDDGLCVADIAAGRGQDQAKCMYAARNAKTHVDAYYARDLSAEDTVSARLMAVKYIAPSARCVSIECGDMGQCWAGIPDAGVDVVSCQLALHYLFDDEAHLRTFFAEAFRVLRPNGLVIVSYADGRSIIRRGRDAYDGSAVNVQVRARYYSFSIPASHLRRALPSPFNLAYTFTLPGSVEAIPEFLAHEGCIGREAARVGFTNGASMFFDEAALCFASHPYYRDISEKMGGNWHDDDDALDTANMYRFSVFAKCASVLKEWDAQTFFRRRL